MEARVPSPEGKGTTTGPSRCDHGSRPSAPSPIGVQEEYLRLDPATPELVA